MGVVKTGKSLIAGAGDGKKSGKGKDFMNGLKDWITSPGGIITLILFVSAMWYIHSKTAPKGAKS